MDYTQRVLPSPLPLAHDDGRFVLGTNNGQRPDDDPINVYAVRLKPSSLCDQHDSIRYPTACLLVVHMTRSLWSMSAPQ